MRDEGATRFLVTTPGLSATRWLSFVLASHPDVFVAHGKHSLESIAHGRFESERQRGDSSSLALGNVMSDFYRCRSLAEVFQTYRDFMPTARAIGNVHSYTLNELLNRFGADSSVAARDLQNIRIANVIRHPIAYITSHTAMVRSAAAHPSLSRHYHQMFSEALELRPELLEIPCPGGEDIEAFVVSCFSASQVLYDLQCDQVPHVRMEDLTSDVDGLAKFCESLTQLPYDVDRLARFVNEGPINRHRQTRGIESPRELYGRWTKWQRHVAALLLSDELLERFANSRYDVSMLQDEDRQGLELARALVPSGGRRLADFVERPRRPAGVDPALDVPTLIEEGFHGFNIVQFRGVYLGLSQALGPVDLTAVDDAWLTCRREARRIAFAESLIVAKQKIDQLVGQERAAASRSGGRLTDLADRPVAPSDSTLATPVLVKESYCGFNVVRFRGQHIGLAQSLGPVDLTAVDENWLNSGRESRQIIVAETLIEAEQLIEQLLAVDTVSAVQLESDCRVESDGAALSGATGAGSGASPRSTSSTVPQCDSASSQ
jgi:hypothetical protein